MKNKNTGKHSKGLSAWQLTMMALGTVIGGSFFLGSSVAIRTAGPSVLLSYIISGVLVYFILYALSEMTVHDPDSGSFRTYATRAYGPGMGFVTGWVYWTGMVLSMSSEATAVSILIRHWFPNVPIGVLGSFIIIGVTLFNLLGADKLSKLESGLAAVKILAIVSFIVIALSLILGAVSGNNPVGMGEMLNQPFMPGGIRGIGGSMLFVMFSYGGFEIIGLAASETENPSDTVPKAIRYTVLCLSGLYVLSIGSLLPLIQTDTLTSDVSPMVAVLNRFGMGFAGTAINIVLITAILSTMLAAMFGIGRMMRSLAEARQAPEWLNDKREVPYHGILFSGFSMLISLGFGLLLPEVYIFLTSSGGFSLLFVYAVIVATHIRYRKNNGVPADGKCQMRGYPYASLIVLICLVISILCMPLVPGQGSGFIAGIIMIGTYSGFYGIIKYRKIRKDKLQGLYQSRKGRLSLEASKELTEEKKEDKS